MKKSKNEPSGIWPIIYPKTSMIFNGHGDCLYYLDGKLVGIQRKNGPYIDKTKTDHETTTNK